jgi:protein gp37
MGADTAIEWTDATWNPVRGCTRVSEGCRNCYAEGVAARFSGPGQPFEGFADRARTGSKWTGKMALVPGMLTQPLRWQKPRRIFVNSMSDLFHEALPDEAIDEVFSVMGQADDRGLGHTFQILTKRSARMRLYMETRARAAWNRARLRPDAWPARNIHLGVSVENQAAADERIPDLLAASARVRFLSCEPLLGPVYLRFVHDAETGECIKGGFPMFGPKPTNRLHWVIAGGESGPGARPMHPDWARSLREQCAAAGVPFFFKQWGEWKASLDREKDDPDWRADYSNDFVNRGRSRWLNLAGGCGFHGDRFHVMGRVGKKAAGRLLDGREHSEVPA